ncbi:MAG: hypothetical protein H6742_01035 [Alphaproteobacteria bacterium]|nr:hypothetical protein [Alphaproteobacteria bacterium]
MPTFLAAIAPGLEPVVQRELADHGIRSHAEPGQVRCELTLQQGAPLAAVLRTPGRWQVEVARGPARSLEQLAVLVRRVDWSPFLRPGDAVTVKATTQRSRLRFADAIEKKTALAVRDATSRARNRGGASVPVRVHIADDEAVLSVDCGGELLHRRGWRQATAKAPIRENLAAALLVMAGWNGDEALVDPFCGAGTLPIEAVRLARGLPPGVGRDYAFTTFPAVRHKESRAHGQPLLVPIVGSDRNPGAVAAASDNAARARVRVDWRQLDVADIEPPAPTGLVISNPPYGVRVGERDGGHADMAGIYASFGRVLRERFEGWRALFLAPHERLALRVHRDAAQLTAFKNGGIRVGVWAVEL